MGKFKEYTMELNHTGLVKSCPEVDLRGQQLDSPSLPLSAAQLDSVGFSIIRKCIHAVETRGKVVQQMASFSVKVTHLGRRQTCYLLFSDFKWLIHSPSAIVGVFPRVTLLWSWSSQPIWCRQPLLCIQIHAHQIWGIIRKPITEVQLVKY